MKRITVFVLCFAIPVFSSITQGQSPKRLDRLSENSARTFIVESGGTNVKSQVNRVVLSLPQAKGAWLIAVSRDGGMRPSKSSVSINSAGDISVTSEHFARGSSIVDCSLKEKLAARDLRALKQAMASATPAAWEDRYFDPAHPICCDQPTTSLTLRWRASDGSTKTYSTSWYPGSARLLPADLVHIEKLIEPLWDKTSDKCDKSN